MPILVILRLRITDKLRSSLNRLMKLRRAASNVVDRFLHRWISLLNGATVQTMRRVAHELHDLSREDLSPFEGKLLRVLRNQLLVIIQEECRTAWTPERSRKDGRGRGSNWRLPKTPIN